MVVDIVTSFFFDTIPLLPSFLQPPRNLRSKKFRRPGEKSPYLEFLAFGNQGVIPPSIHPSGPPYRWLHPQAPVVELTPQRLNWIIVGWTHDGSGILPPLPAIETQTAPPKPKQRSFQGESNGLKEAVLGRWSCLDVFRHFGFNKDGEQKERNGEVRLLRNGGLLVDTSKDRWNMPGEKGTGGGPLEAWWYCQHGNVSVPHDSSFYELLIEMAEAGGVEIPKRTPDAFSPLKKIRELKRKENRPFLLLHGDVGRKAKETLDFLQSHNDPPAIFVRGREVMRLVF
jgi:hypothetical protein